MGFPPPGAEIFTNEAGEYTGYDVPAEPDYCDIHGISYRSADCPACVSEYEDEEEYEDEDLEDYDPGPEIDDQGGMSEFFPADPGNPPF